MREPQKRISPLAFIRLGFIRIFDPEGDILDSASPKLAGIRRNLNALRGKIQRTMQSMITEPRMEGFLQEKFVTQRDDRNQAVASGIYFIHMVMDGKRISMVKILKI